jgi:hypothetical protein
VTIIATPCPNHHDHSVTDQTHGNEPRLTIVEPQIRILDEQAVEHNLCIREVQSAFLQRLVTLCRIEGYRYFT